MEIPSQVQILTGLLPRKKGAFPLLHNPIQGDRQMDWLERSLTVPRTFREWWDLIREYKTPPHVAAVTGFKWNPPPFPDYKQGDYLHPYFHRQVAGTLLEGWWFQNQRLRWICRKWIHRIQMRTIARRQHGAVDLATCEPIPTGHRVTVFDMPSRSVYNFHTYTVHKSILRDILFQQYGIPDPRVPKNPYTNIPWSVGQLCVIMDQVQANMWRTRHRFVDCVLVKFRQAGYDIKEFYRIFSKHLMFRSAVTFFKDPTTDAWDEIYAETYDDLLLYTDTQLRSHEICSVRNYLIHRTLPKGMLDAWDNMMIAYWMHENHGEWTGFNDADAMYDEAARLVGRTHVWITEDCVRIRSEAKTAL